MFIRADSVVPMKRSTAFARDARPVLFVRGSAYGASDGWSDPHRGRTSPQGVGESSSGIITQGDAGPMIFGQNGVMVQQVLMRIDGGAPSFETTDNPGSRAPMSFEDPSHGVRIPRLGSQDILRIAEFAARTGYHLDGFQLGDSTLTPVGEALGERVSKQLVKRLRRGETAADVDDYLAAEWPTLAVIGVVLTTPALGTARLQRQGVLSGPSDWSPKEFLTNAWQAVRFS